MNDKDFNEFLEELEDGDTCCSISIGGQVRLPIIANFICFDLSVSKSTKYKVDCLFYQHSF